MKKKMSMSQPASQVALRAVILIVLSVILGAFTATAHAQTLASFSDDMGETVFYVGEDHHVHRVNCDRGALCLENRFWLNTDLTNELKIGAVFPLGPITAFTNGSGEHLFFVDWANNINRLDCTDHCDLGNKWTNHNLHVQSSCSQDSPRSTCSLSSYSDTETFGVDSYMLYYQAADQHIHVYGGDSPTPAPLAAAGILLSSFRTGSGWQSGEYLYYADINSHIHQLYGQWDEDENGGMFLTWVDQDLTAQTRAPGVSGGLASFSDASGPQVYFAGNLGQHVYRIYSSGNLVSQDLSQNTTPYGGAMSGLSDSSGESVFYVGVDSHLHKLYCPGGSNCNQPSNWINQDMTRYYSGPPVGNLCPNNLTSFSDAYGESVFYVAADSTLHRLSTSAGDQTLVSGGQSGPANSCIQN